MLKFPKMFILKLALIPFLHELHFFSLNLFVFSCLLHGWEACSPIQVSGWDEQGCRWGRWVMYKTLPSLMWPQLGEGKGVVPFLDARSHQCWGTWMALILSQGCWRGEECPEGVTCVVSFVLLQVGDTASHTCQLSVFQSLHSLGAWWRILPILLFSLLFFPFYGGALIVLCWIREASCPIFYVHPSMFSFLTESTVGAV